MPVAAPVQRSRRARVASRGFTLLELLVVLVIIALASGGVVLAMRQPSVGELQSEAVRLAALLDAARGQSRASGVRIIWELSTTSAGEPAMRWRGATSRQPLPTTWLHPDVRAAVLSTPPIVVLGPDPIISPVRVRLTLGQQSVEVVSDGVGAFTVDTAPPS